MPQVVTPFNPRPHLSVLDEVFVEQARARLVEVGRTHVPLNRETQRVLVQLSEELFALWARGFTSEEISALLGQSNIGLSAETLREYFDQVQVGRMATLERQFAVNLSSKSNGANHRTTLIEQGLRLALQDGNGLVLHYQPQVHSASGEVLGAEALVRWRHNDILMPPDEFIPIAEESELILEVGEWVLREACREAKRWQALGLGGQRGIKMGVNLSVKQLTGGLVDLVHGVLCDTGLPTNLLGLEVTEGSIVGSNSMEVLHKLSSSGIHLSIDDFGTGYSCLSQLKDMPLDTVKIDQSFVRSLGRGEVPTLVVEAIINLAHKLNKTTLAEGVETWEQAQALERMGCSVCQGSYYAMPLPANAFVRFVSDQTDSRQAHRAISPADTSSTRPSGPLK